MENCEDDQTITVEDGLECPDRGGVVAEMGARILYLLTGRDGLGWHHAGYNELPFHTDKQNWLDLGRFGVLRMERQTLMLRPLPPIVDSQGSNMERLAGSVQPGVALETGSG